jgi:uncharacterized protein (DUF1697 family)
MATHAAFLRGINLGKHRRVKNDALAAALEAIGLDGVATFRASGNLVFEAADDSDLAERLEAGLAEALGFEVAVFLRSARQMRAIARRDPFGEAARAASAGKLQVALLPRKPAAAARRQALSLATERDPLAIHGSELFWLPAGRMVESDLDLKALEAAVGPWTMRTMGTIEQIAARHFV